MKIDSLLDRLERYMGEGYFPKLMAILVGLIALLLALNPILSHFA